MPSSRLEINFQRLLTRCETMAGETTKGGWRLDKVSNNCYGSNYEIAVKLYKAFPRWHKVQEICIVMHVTVLPVMVDSDVLLNYLQ